MRTINLGSVMVAALFITIPAVAADLPTTSVYKAPLATPAPAWFIEGRAGGSFGRFDDLKFLNPDGIAFTTNPVSGNYIILNGKDLSDSSFTGGTSVGYFLNNYAFVKASYQYFGTFKASGYANFPAGGGNFQQEIKTVAHGLLLGIGADFDIIDNRYFIEPTAEIGVGFLHSTGRQGANLGASNTFPSKNNTNFIGGAGLSLGYHVNKSFDVLVGGHYYWLGKADTGITGNPPPAGMNTGEQLQAKLQVFTVTLAARLHF